jgi:hypothetical protein
VGGQFRGEVPDPVAEGIRAGVAEFGLAGVPEEAGPGGEVGGDCGWWLPGTPSMPEPGMFVQMIEYRQPVSFS